MSDPIFIFSVFTLLVIVFSGNGGDDNGNSKNGPYIKF